jgi:hypothetical protein
VSNTAKLGREQRRQAESFNRAQGREEKRRAVTLKEAGRGPKQVSKCGLQNPIKHHNKLC